MPILDSRQFQSDSRSGGHDAYAGTGRKPATGDGRIVRRRGDCAGEKMRIAAAIISVLLPSCASVGNACNVEYRISLPGSVPFVNGDFVVAKKTDNPDCEVSAPDS